MFKKIWHSIMKTVEVSIVVSLCLIGIVLFSQVVARYVFKSPMLWPEEATVSLMIWITFLGLSYGVENRLHVRMSSFVSKLSFRFQQFFSLLMDVIMLSGTIYLIPTTIAYYNSRVTVISPSLGISYGFVYFCIPVGFILLSCSLLRDMIRIIQGDIPK